MLSRIDRLLEGIEDSCAVLISGYPNIFYYSGFTSEDAYLLLSKDRRLIITDSRYTIQAKEQAVGFDVVDISRGWGAIFGGISETSLCFEEEKMTVAEYSKLKSAAHGKEFVKGQDVIDAPRRVKDKEEIRLISEAEKIGDEAFSHVLEFVRPGITELEVALELETYMKKNGASGLSFETIAASGVRSAMPHGAASEKVIEKGDFLTLDFGCVYKGYCSDMTRTVVVGRADERQREIYGTVLKAQQAAIDGIYDGIACAEADAIARRIISDAGYGENFGHSLGHSVGIEIHERPNFSPKSKDTLENGNVLSVEPGIYIDGFGGVRIEDLIAVSDGEIIDLTHSPKELIEL
ncbi:MAG TPA: aminopeptidase P family protein [Candidatus Ornithomonoglobus merdipullorum]|uniref:Aminopeptidase P family protein n=1 Tax=Candidatus Ornithomonoglobus merdipullorum TaxID=2840895 RepID=A0A9D1SDQ6_9FIRM|nr:aminopeptidase P family protein [Candidatus Ornithomonoglobus merdipullorum]